VVSFTPRPIYPQGNIPWYSLDRRLGGAYSRSIYIYTHTHIYTYIYTYI